MNIHFLKRLSIITAAFTLLSGCNTPLRLYKGDPKPPEQIATLTKISPIDTPPGTPALVVNLWKVNGVDPHIKGEAISVYEIEPGKYELGFVLNLVNAFPVILLRQLKATYWVTFEARAGYVYQYFADNKDTEIPSQICVWGIPREKGYIALQSGMNIPDFVVNAGCGSPRNPVDKYEFRTCSFLTPCILNEENIKP